jgi:ferredoxin
MTRQCAWCATYLDLVQSETCVTHGICESCVGRIRRATLEQLAPPSDAVLAGDNGRRELALH